MLLLFLFLLNLTVRTNWLTSSQHMWCREEDMMDLFHFLLFIRRLPSKIEWGRKKDMCYTLATVHWAAIIITSANVVFFDAISLVKYFIASISCRMSCCEKRMDFRKLKIVSFYFRRSGTARTVLQWINKMYLTFEQSHKNR